MNVALHVLFTHAMNEKLVISFTTLELFKLVKHMVDGKALGLDGISI